MLLSEKLANKHTYKRERVDPVKTFREKQQQAKGESEQAKTLPDELTFSQFTRWFSYPAYKGLHRWQRNCHLLTYPAKYSEILVPREHGKSVLLADEMEYAMQYDEMDVLLLGWTSRRKDLAEFVYAFFTLNDLVEVDQRTSSLHFRIENGGRFDTYLITSKETLGKHAVGKMERFNDLTEEEEREMRALFEDLDDETLKEYMENRDQNRKLWIVIDDPIDDTFREERHKERKLERRFDSTIYNINPDKFTFCGTKKFEEDFFYYIENKFSDRLIQYKRDTGVESGNLLCPERFTHPKLDTYKQDLKDGKRDLSEIRNAIGEYWWEAEYEQNPHPITGEVWERSDLTFIHELDHFQAYDLVCISVDRATTRNKTSDLTGITEIVRHRDTQNKTVIKDLTGKYSFYDTMDLIEDLYQSARTHYNRARIIVVIEKQGGGDDLIDAVEESGGYRFKSGIIAVHSTRKKEFKIRDWLEIPIRRGYIQFLSSLANSELIEEITSFPYSQKFDAVDSLAMGSFEMDKINPTRFSKKEIEERVNKLKWKQTEKRGYKHPWEKRNDRRTIF